MIKAIIFDIGGVIIIEPHDSWKIIFSELGPSIGISTDTLISNFKSNEHSIQIGSITLLDLYRKLLKTLNRDDIEPEVLLQGHIALYNKISGKYDTKLIDIIKKLRQKFKVACFTNTEVEIALLNKERELFDCFDQIFISTEMGLRKPNPESYQYVIDKLKVKPGEAIFIDNNKEYVDAAEECGIKGILYKNVEGLVKELAKYSVDVK